MNHYEQKQAGRKERQAERAERLQREAEATYKSARDAVAAIPFGQPILVGHHSENRHRQDLERHDTRMRKSFDLQKHADEMARRAATESNTISSDDPDAPDKLRERIAKLEGDQAKMIAANKLVKKGDREALAAMFSPKVADGLLAPDFAGRLGFASYMLTNNNANIRRLKQRAAALEKQATATPNPDLVGDGWTIREDVADNRLLIIFDEIPDAEIRTKLKGAGFKWSPTRKAWVRMLSNSAQYSARDALGQFT